MCDSGCSGTPGAGFGSSSFRYAALPAELDDCRLSRDAIATAYPNLVRKDLATKGIEATVIRLDGAVEISVPRGGTDAIADVVGSGRTSARPGGLW